MYTTLISTQELASAIPKLAWVIVDCRFSLSNTEEGRNLYRKAHIPGSFYAHLDEDLSGKIIPGKTGRHPLPKVEDLVTTFSNWGINEQIQVVAYDDKGGGIASRLWWLLKWLGHERVAVLDGGWPTWEKENLPTSDISPSPIQNTFIAKENPSLVVDLPTLEKTLEKKEGYLFDSRDPKRFSGEHEPIDPIAGHIPGAINVPFKGNLMPDGTFLPKEELRQRFDYFLPGGKTEEAVFYCGSGVTACHNLLALNHAGFEGAKLFPGSWSEWITKPERPIETN